MLIDCLQLLVYHYFIWRNAPKLCDNSNNQVLVTQIDVLIHVWWAGDDRNNSAKGVAGSKIIWALWVIHTQNSNYDNHYNNYD